MVVLEYMVFPQLWIIIGLWRMYLWKNWQEIALQLV